MAAPCVIDFPHPAAAEAEVRGAPARAGCADSAPRLARWFADIVRLFGGSRPGIQACDMRDHNLKHTLEAMVRTARILCGQARGFWAGFVRPMLDHDTGGLHRYLCDPGQPNPYLAAAGNLQLIARRTPQAIGPAAIPG